MEANFPDGTKKILFRTTEPGFATEDAMRAVVEWYGIEREVHPIIACAFMDGNGRMGRLWQTVVLMKANPVFEY